MTDRLSARGMIGQLATEFDELDPGAHESAASTVDGPIGWSGYDKAKAYAIERTGEVESVVCGVATIDGIQAVLISFEFEFLGGSVGGHTGLLIEAAFARAVRLRVPVVTLTATGGSRMQEGMRALSQLQRIARASAVARAEGIPQLAVLRDPTTGGGWATLGAGADVTLALTGAQIGFAGSRVRPAGDASAYTAEAQFAAGHVDQVLEPDALPAALGRWLALFAARTPSPEPAEVPAALGPERAGHEERPPAESPGERAARRAQRSEHARIDTDWPLPTTGWDAVRRARDPERPRAGVYLDAYFDSREQISGDRCGGVDTGVLCGFGSRRGRTIAYAAQCGTPTHPSGFRTAARLVRMADRLGIPVLTLVDTPGAANDAAAERAGVGPAIAELFAAMAAARVPVTSLVIGEGGSGGALAFAAPGRTWVTPDGYFAVTSPEAAASILKRDPSEVPVIANELRLRPQDLVELGVAVGIARRA